MIQRIQSVWLLLATIFIFLTLKLSFYTGTYLPVNAYHQLNGTGTILLMVTTIILGALTFFTIFLYKQRMVQMWLIILAIVIELLLVYLYYRETLKFSQGVYAITAALHIVVIIALIFAARGINSDEKLIRSSDRLR